MALRDFYPLQTPKRTHYCPVCRLKRSVAYREYLLAWQWAQMAVVVIFLTWLFYRMFDFKTLLLILPLYMAYEFNNRIFNLRQLICTRCNFDPIQYKSDPQVAIEVAKQKLTTISQELELQNPGYTLLKNQIMHKKKEKELRESSHQPRELTRKVVEETPTPATKNLWD